MITALSVVLVVLGSVSLLVTLWIVAACLLTVLKERNRIDE